MADLLYPKIRDKKRRRKHKPSIIQEKDGRCYLCMKLHADYSFKYTEEHHVYFGRGQRDISEAQGGGAQESRDVPSDPTGSPEKV